MGTANIEGFSSIQKIKANETITLTINAHVDEEIKVREIVNKITAYIMLPSESGLEEEEEERKTSEISKELKNSVDVKIEVESIIIPEKLEMKKGETKPLEILLEPEYATLEDVEIKVEQDDDDLNVIRLDENLNIHAINPGYAFVVVTSKADSNIEMKMFVEVIESDNEDQGTEQNPGEEPGENPGEDSEQDNEKERTYKISGLAWLDENDDGTIGEEEKLLKGILVKLKDVSTNEYVKDDNNQVISVITDENGKYEFTNLKPGKYVAEFEYNKNKYKLTSISNKDSVANLVTQEGITLIVTDTLIITNEDISNINIGLNLNPVFDLQLDKYISKVTVQNSEGTRIYNYNEEQLAKIDISAKKMNGSTIIVEYIIEVTNNGAVPGYAKNIVDYVAPDFKFNSEMNTNWYQGSDNNLYCEALANEVIEAGQSKQVRLVLTKTMTNSNTGLVNNSAEIYRSYNEYALEDINSSPDNKEQKENDYSMADIIITVTTGGPALYIGIVLTCMCVLGIAIYLINKKIINRKEFI